MDFCYQKIINYYACEMRYNWILRQPLRELILKQLNIFAFAFLKIWIVSRSVVGVKGLSEINCMLRDRSLSWGSSVIVIRIASCNGRERRRVCRRSVFSGCEYTCTRASAAAPRGRMHIERLAVPAFGIAPHITQGCTKFRGICTRDTRYCSPLSHVTAHSHSCMFQRPVTRAKLFSFFLSRTKDCCSFRDSWHVRKYNLEFLAFEERKNVSLRNSFSRYLWESRSWICHKYNTA